MKINVLNFLRILVISLCFITKIRCFTTSLHLYTKTTASAANPSEIVIDENNAFRQFTYLKDQNNLCWKHKEDCTSYLIIHGFIDNYKASWIENMRKEFFIRHTASGLINVFVASWDSGPFYNYLSVIRNNMPQSAIQMSNIIEKLSDYGYLQKNTTTLYLHCIGHSLGSHMCGLFSKELNRSKNIKPRRITALDPADPCIKHWNDNKRLTKSDTYFLDVIHSSNFLGMYQPIGHVDFYPNGGKDQPKCVPLNYDLLTYIDFNTHVCDDKSQHIQTDKSIVSNVIEFLTQTLLTAMHMNCAHGRAHVYFTKSINKCAFEAFTCSSYKDFEKGMCFNGNSNRMGLHATRPSSSVNTNYYVTTSGKDPFCYNECQYKETKGVCTKVKGTKRECEKPKNNECDKNSLWCCKVGGAKISEKDLTFLINTQTNSNQVFNRSLDVASRLIEKSDVDLDSTRIAIVTYSDSNVQTLTYLKDKNSDINLLNIVNSINFETNQLNSQTLLFNALKQCKNVYSIENGMREFSKGIAKQIILITGEIVSNSGEILEIFNEFRSQGIEILNVVTGSEPDLDVTGTYTFFMNGLDEDDYEGVIDYIQSFISSDPALISQQTGGLTIDDEEIKYFRYPIDSSNSNKIEIIIENLIGLTKIFASFDKNDPTSNFDPEIDEYGSKDNFTVLSIERSSQTTSLDIPKDSGNLYIIVQGIEPDNTFSIKIYTKQTNSASTICNESNYKIFLLLVITLYLFKSS